MAADIMGGVTEERIDGGGVQIFVRSRRPASASRAIIVICHGFNAHSGRYLWTIEQLAAAGLSVYAFDLRGRGKSDGARFYVESIADYVANVSAVVKLAKSREPGLPVFLLGHSAGGVVSCTYALDYRTELAGLICESFAFQAPAPDLVLTIVKGLSRVAPRLPVLKLKNQDFSRDPIVVKAMNDDPLTANETQPAITIAALVRGNERLKKEFRLMTLPVFILHGTLDKATKPSGSQFFYDTVGSRDKTLKFYEGHYHDLLNDFDKEKVMEDMKGWIARHLP